MQMLLSVNSPPPSEQPHVTAKQHRIFIVDDHPAFRFGLSRLIGKDPDFEVCGEAGCAGDALSMLRLVDADLAVIDISLPGSNGIDLIKSLKSEHATLRFFVLSAHDESAYAVRSLRAGASGYMMKDAAADRIVPALRRVLDGKLYVSDALRERLVVQVLRGKSETADSPLDRLSDREFEVLNLVGHGRTSVEIAAALNLSTKTVETHRRRMKEKLGLQSSTELVRFAYEWVENQTGDIGIIPRVHKVGRNKGYNEASRRCNRCSVNPISGFRSGGHSVAKAVAQKARNRTA